MKLTNLLILIVLVVLSFSCKRENPLIGTNDSANNDKSIQLKQYQPPPTPYENWGFFAVQYDNDCSNLITSFYNQGWNGIILDDYFREGGIKNYAAAVTAGYIPRFVSISYKYLGSDTVLAMWEINYAKGLGATWVYLDDALTNYYNHPYHPNDNHYNDSIRNEFPYIPDSRMNWLCDFVHSLDMKMAVGEGSEVMHQGQLISDSNRTHFYDKVDFVMPYGYDSTPAQLSVFYAYIHYTLYKSIIPILRNDQRGSRSGQPDYIELAKSWAYNSWVFYWPENNDPTNLIPVNQYLQDYDYIYP